MDGLAKYLVSLVSEAVLADIMNDEAGEGKTHNVDAALVKVEAKLQELVNSEIELSIAAVKLQSKEWGEVVRSPKLMCNEFIKKLQERIKK
jgi:hypothetical protein